MDAPVGLKPFASPAVPAQKPLLRLPKPFIPLHHLLNIPHPPGGLSQPPGLHPKKPRKMTTQERDHILVDWAVRHVKPKGIDWRSYADIELHTGYGIMTAKERWLQLSKHPNVLLRIQQARAALKPIKLPVLEGVGYGAGAGAGAGSGSGQGVKRKTPHTPAEPPSTVDEDEVPLIKRLRKAPVGTPALTLPITPEG